MEYEVLGPVRLRRGAEPARLGRLQRTLLAVLLVHANRPVSSDLLTEVLWPDAADRRGEQNLRLHVHRLRRALGSADRLVFEPGGYRLSVSPGELDAERFETLVDEASEVAASEPERCVALVRKALDLWRGRAYDGLDVPSVGDEAQRLEDRRVVATEALFEAELACGRDVAVVAELSDLVRRYPLRERLRALLMVALYRSGRQADALQVYQDARCTLVDELGLEPGPQLRAVEQQVLAGEPVTLGRGDSSPGVPAQLPVNVRGFVGREDQIAAMDRLLSVDPDAMPIASLSGTAGVGKTALAVRWAHRVQDQFPDGQLYVDLRGFGPHAPVDAGDALSGFLRALGLEGSAIPQDLEERSARFRSLVDGRRLLVVLDNARTVDQVRPLLPGTSSCVVLITSRNALSGLGAREGARRIDLDRLDPAEARRLLTDLLGAETVGDTAATDRLIEQCARLPLALRIAADLVSSRPARGVGGLVAELTDERDRLDLLDVDDAHSAVRAVFSWSYQLLSPAAARLFRACGLHPGHDLDAYALAALAGSDLGTARRHLDTLVRAHLIDETFGVRFRPHDLLRAYARELVERDDAADRTDAIERLAAYYLYTARTAMELIAPFESDKWPAIDAPSTPAPPSLSTYDQALAWLEREIDNLLATAAVAPDGYTATLSDLLYRYFEIRGYYDQALALHGWALAIARRDHDARAESSASRLVANVHYFRANFDESIRYDERALALSRECGDRRGEVRALTNLGATRQRLGGLREALRCFEAAAALYAERGEQDLATITNLANLQRQLGDYASAHTSLDEALALARELGDRNTRDTILCMLGDLAARTGRIHQGLDYARQALDGSREAGNRSAEADALNELGDCHRRAGDHEEAQRCFETALGIARSTGNEATVAEALNGLGRSLRDSGEPDRALREHRAALDAATSSGVRYEEAGARAGLGDAYADLGDREQAREHRRRGLEVYSDLGVPEADEVRSKLSGPD